MMKLIFSVLATLLILLISFQQIIIVMLFKLNHEAIEQKFCSNKNQPALQCHGICYLKKVLKKTENSNPQQVKGYKNIDMILFSNTETQGPTLLFLIRGRVPVYKDMQYREPYLEIFRPPPSV